MIDQAAAEIDRKAFFDSIRMSVFNGVLSQRQVDGMEYLLDVWEGNFRNKDIRWLAYAMATVYHETAAEMRPIEEYGRGQGKSYGAPTGPHGQCYYGRGHVQLTWIENYEKGERVLTDKYGVDAPLVEYPHRMLEDEPSALILFDGLIEGWFTGLGLPAFFNDDTEDPYNARKCVNGLDRADLIEGYYHSFREALV
jgi:predicted chitinase